jgi:hypothetical protein
MISAESDRVGLSRNTPHNRGIFIASVVVEIIFVGLVRRCSIGRHTHLQFLTLYLTDLSD